LNDTLNEPSPGIMEGSLTRRAVIGRAAGAGIAAGAAYLSRSSVSAAERGIQMNQATPTANAAPTVVLVHGAFADSSGWEGVIKLLVADGVSVFAASNPLRGIANDSAYVASVVAAVPGPVLLVGHSYGGAVISGAAVGAENVVGLIYVAAFALDEGEAGLAALGQFPPTPLAESLRPATTDPQNPDLLIDPIVFHEVFAADIAAEEAAWQALTQRPVLGSAFVEPAGPVAWKTLPSWFAIPTIDNVIGTPALRFFAERAGSITVEIPDASHAVMISQPRIIADLIKTALGTIS
jgi:pimeloyl-ACP methyl ester carboxylesterase